jgi:hypothetical protein
MDRSLTGRGSGDLIEYARVTNVLSVSVPQS